MNTLAPLHPSPSSPKGTGDAYLKFQLCPQTLAIFSMKHVQEAIMLPVRRLSPMPNMPPHLLGLMNRRSRVVWVVDLAQLLGLAILDLPIQYYRLVMIQVGAVPLALAVQHIEGIMWADPDAVQSPIGQVPSTLVPYLQGCLLQRQEQSQDILMVLDAEAIAHSLRLWSS